MTLPEPNESEQQSDTSSWVAGYLLGHENQPGGSEPLLKELIKSLGLRSTMKGLKRAKKKAKMATVTGGVMQIQRSGRIEAALETDDGPKVVYGQCDTDVWENDPQITVCGLDGLDAIGECSNITPDALLDRLSADSENIPCDLIIETELTRFDTQQQKRLLPVLWTYILAHRNSNNSEELVATGSAIRKYIALMPMDQMENLATLLDSENRSPLPLELELEIAKMIYRNFEVHPPAQANPQPRLAEHLWQMAQTYLNPRLLLRDKYSAVASLSIVAIVAMRSDFAGEAWASARKSPHRWFCEIVSDDLTELWKRWNSIDTEAAQWLVDLRSRIMDESGT
jgi:hypothetical protein